jgi:uncharacterized membrane protein (TIGR02234 family)
MIIVGLLVGAGLLWASSKLAWSWSVEVTPLHGKVVNALDGDTQAPALIPLALLSLAAIAATLATRGWVRRIVGGLVVLAGLGMIVVAFTQLAGVFGAHPNGYPLSQIVLAHVLALLAGGVVAAAGMLIVRGAESLPGLGANYETPAGGKRKRDPDDELWRALSDGEDPTARD